MKIQRFLVPLLAILFGILTIFGSWNSEAQISQDPERKTLEATNYGVKCDGITDTTKYAQSALLAGAGNIVLFPSGICVITATLRVPSNTEVIGAGDATTIQGAPDLRPLYTSSLGRGYILLTNNDFVAGNSNIVIHDIAFDSSLVQADGHNLLFYNAADIRLFRITTIGGGDGIAFVHTKNARASHNHIIDAKNAGLDSWDGTRDTAFVNNIVQCPAIGPGDGILLTGLSTGNTAAKSVHPVAIGNVLQNCSNNAIWVQGGSDGASQIGQVTDFIVSGNVIDTVRTFHGIRVSEAEHGRITDNLLKNISATAIMVGRENILGEMTDVLIENNTILNADTRASGDAAIFVGTGSDGVSVCNNRVSGSKQSYSLFIAAGAIDTYVRKNHFAKGTHGTYSDSGLHTTIDDGDNSFNVKRSNCK